MQIEKNIDIKHYPGRHCASTGICNIVNYHGIAWSEAMCFGIGAGLGLWYLRLEGNSPSRLIHVRSMDIEAQFFNRVAPPFEWRQYKTPEESENDLIAILYSGNPVIIQTDIFHLPYFNSSAHFPGHVITVWGYDSNKKLFFVSDTERIEILEVPFENMRRARFSRNSYINHDGNLYFPESISIPENMTEIIQEAIISNSKLLLDNTSYFYGIRAIEEWLKEITVWNKLDDWQWTARFSYQIIEKRGTGGGAFRFLYSDFLHEASEYVPNLASHGLPQMMKELGNSWQNLAFSLKDASDKSIPDFSDVHDKLEMVYKLESEYHKGVIDLFSV